MKRRELLQLGLQSKELQRVAKDAFAFLRRNGASALEARERIRALVNDSAGDFDDGTPLTAFARMLHASRQSGESYEFRQDAEFAGWGLEGIDPGALEQMKHAVQLPISRFAALMPDAHVGYGLPIGGVLATKDAVIPYAVGVDIACRVKLSVFDISLVKFNKDRARFARAIENNTQFGIGAKWKSRKEHAVLDANWEQSRFVAGLKDLAWSQLGTSGSGNHFVEFGELHVEESLLGLSAGTYLALVSHSGSRGAGSRVASHFTKIAMSQHENLPKQCKHLAWLSMNTEGAEYWSAMELMGRYASANHAVIHESIRREIGAKTLAVVENHHNFAWKETHFGEDCIVHRKGATPAAVGELGYIPGTMADPGFVVEGLGNIESLHSSSHGAGRALSRTQAKNSVTRSALAKRLRESGVEVLSCGLDESPHAYKDIHEVMRAQQALVRIRASFEPKLVKMAPDGERAED